MITILDLKTNKTTKIFPKSETTKFPVRNVAIKVNSNDSFPHCEKRFKNLIKEIQGHLNELMVEGFARKVNNKYKLTPKGKAYIRIQRH